MQGVITREFDFAAAKVLVIGDLILDRFRYGSVSRVSPEAPVPVIHVTRDQDMLGGAGNVLANVCALGASGALIAVVGADDAGAACARLLAGHGGDPDLLVTVAQRPTTLKTRFISGGQQLLRCDEEDVRPFADMVADSLIERIDRVLPDYDVVALSDYAKGVLGDRVLRHVIGRCALLGKPVIVDPKRQNFAAYAGCAVIKPNRSELGAFAGQHCTNLADSAKAAERAMAATGAAVLLTLSEQGMALFRPAHDVVHLQATATEIFDVSGAGDTVLAIFCCAFASGLAMEECAMLANAGAGAAVRKLGTTALSKAELARAVAVLQDPSTSGVCTLEHALYQVDLWKQDGLRVGFTNGCFDVVHAGHIEILRQARARCDRLVVGLNSDASVARLKGPSRPVQQVESRAIVLAAIDAVDLVVVFEQDTPLEVIRALRPTDLIKGADYAEDQVVGAPDVKAGGGRVHLIELVPGLSTTAAVDRMIAGKSARADTSDEARQLHHAAEQE